MVKVALQLGPHDAGIQLTAEEFAKANYVAPFIYERVQGRLVVMSPAGSEHRHVSRPFRRVLGGYWNSNPDLIDDVDVEGWVSTSQSDDRIPDICVYLAGASSAERVPQRVPDLIYEFVSENRSDQERDYIDKRAEYHSIGVKEYVIVDRFKKGVLVLTWSSGDFSDKQLNSNDVYTSPLLPGLRIDLSEAFG